MKRQIDSVLKEWKQSKTRKPLLIFGARQVGKTYALLNFGKTSFDNYVHIDFPKDASASSIFEKSLDPSKIISTIEALSHKQIKPENTLIIFDEIQLCERALTSLKYFCEEAPQYFIAAAGSLLGVKLRENGSFPVGKVDMLTLHPIDFEEFLWANGEEKLSLIIEECTSTLEFCPLHEEALAKYREYLLVGGMPDAVNCFISNQNIASCFDSVRAKQTEINQSYIADVVKHAPSNLVPRILDVWQNMPAQLAKENSKFQYKAIRSGARASLYEEPVAWLLAAAVASKCARVTEPVAPLGIFEDAQSFKLYLADTGILASTFDALPADVLPQSSKSSRFRGALAENYVMQQLLSADVKPYYWGTPSKQEVDFVARDKKGDIIPIEVKSGSNVRANSLSAYREKYNPPYVARLSTKNFGEHKFVKSYPLYSACYYAKSFIKSPAFI